MSQPACLKKALQGNREAVEELVVFCYPVVFRYLMKRTRSRETAMDLTQDAMVRMLESLQTYVPRTGSTFLSWVLRIAHNRWIDHMRSMRCPVPLTDMEDSALPTGDDSTALTALEKMDAAELERMLMRLSPRDRELLRLRYWLGCSHKEAAAILGIKPLTIKSRLNAALKRLGKQYDTLKKESADERADASAQ